MIADKKSIALSLPQNASALTVGRKTKILMKQSTCGSFKREVRAYPSLGLSCARKPVNLLNVFMISTLVHVPFFATFFIQKGSVWEN